MLTAAVLVMYVVLVVLVLPRHEPFGDEQNAWTIALHNSLGHIFGTILREHEGTPGLWHLMLWVLARLHWSFLDARWLAALFPVGGVYVWMRWAPFPLWLRTLVPFTFFLVYQYAIVARQYVLFPLLVFALAALACSARWRPWSFAVCAGLLANLSFHGFCFALTFTGAVYVLRRRLPFYSAAGPASLRIAPNTGPLALLALCVLVAVATAVPIPHPHPTVNPEPILLPASLASIPLELPMDTPWLHVPPPGMNSLQTAVWRATMLRDGLNPASTPRAKALHAIIIGLSLLTFPIAKSNLLAFVLLALIYGRLNRRRSRVLLVPYGVLWGIMLFLHGYEHHTGMLLIALLTALWISFVIDPLPAESVSPTRTLAALIRRPNPHRLDDALLLTLGMVLILQLGWSVHALRADYYRPYTGDEQAARFLQRIAPQKTIARGPIGLGDNPPFYTHGFESPAITAAAPPFSANEQQSMRALLARVALHPDYIIEGAENVGTDSLKNQITPMAAVGGADYMADSLRILANAGYHETHRFCGENFMRDGYSRQLCQIVFEPDQH